MTSQKYYGILNVNLRITEKRKEETILTIAEANEPIATGIKVIIAKTGLKNLHVAKKAGFTPQELSDMFNGRRLIKACDIPKFAHVLGVKTDDIYAAGRKEES